MRAAIGAWVGAVVAAALLVAVPAAGAAPTCATVPASVVRSEFGLRGQSSVNAASYSLGDLKFVDCEYLIAKNTLISIYYVLPSTALGWRSLLPMVGLGASWQRIPGIGTAAASATVTTSSITYAHGNQPTRSTTRVSTAVVVLIRGVVLFAIEGPRRSLAHEKALAKRMIGLI